MYVSFRVPFPSPCFLRVITAETGDDGNLHNFAAIGSTEKLAGKAIEFTRRSLAQIGTINFLIKSYFGVSKNDGFSSIIMRIERNSIINRFIQLFCRKNTYGLYKKKKLLYFFEDLCKSRAYLKQKKMKIRFDAITNEKIQNKSIHFKYGKRRVTLSNRMKTFFYQHDGKAPKKRKMSYFQNKHLTNSKRDSVFFYLFI